MSAKSLALSYAMKKRKASGYSKGGMATDCESGDMVDMIMKKRMAKGGEVEGGDDNPDMDPNEFDYLELNEPEEFSYTGDNSGDYIDNEGENKDRRDIVSMIMASRRKK